MAVNQGSTRLALQSIDGDLIDSGEQLILSDRRREVALQAVWEVDQLCRALYGAVRPSETQEWLLVRGLSARVQELNDAIGAALSDDDMATADLWYTVCRERIEVAA